MNLKKINLKNLFKRSPKKREYPNLSLKAAHDWKMMLVLFFFLTILVAVLNFSLFLRVSEGEAFTRGSTSSSDSSSVDINLLKKTLSFFEEKEKVLEILLENGTNIIDPSL